MRNIEIVDSEIFSIRKKCARVKKINTILLDLKEQLKDKELLQLNRKEALKKEIKDVNILESFSLKSVLASFSGDKKSKLEKERLDVEKEKLKYKKVSEEIEYIKTRICALKEELQKLGNPSELLNKILKEKEEILKVNGGEKYSCLLDIDENLLDLKIKLKEIKEAVVQGDNTLLEMNKMGTILESASNYGTWDMLGGGLLVTSMKHAELDKLEEQVKTVQQALVGFRNEIVDVSSTFEISLIEKDSFMKFSDFFLDNIFVDYMVQEKISNAIKVFKERREEISQIMTKLGDTELEVINNISKLEAKREKILCN